jgi:hypothetical protein
MNNINTYKEINKELSELIHDKHFSLEKIQLNGNDLIVPFIDYIEIFDRKNIIKKVLIFQKYQYELYKATLIFKNVKNYEIEDTERIDTYDINEMFYNDGIIQIKTNVPLTFTIYVDKLEIQLIVEKCGEKTSWGI